MKQFGRWSALWQSFHSRDLYRDVALRWKGIGCLYLLLLLAITWLPSVARWGQGLREFADGDARAAIAKLPDVTIRDGVMSADPPGRHVVTAETDASGRPTAVLIVDDTVDAAPGDAVEVDTFIVTRREAGAIRPSRGERRVYMLSPEVNMTLTRQDIQAFVDAMSFWLPPIGYVGAVLGSLAFRLLQVLLYGAFAMTYARSQKVTMTYASAVRVAAVAVTPVIVIRTLIWFGSWDPAWYLRWPAAIAITAGYLIFAIRAVAEADEVAPPSPHVHAG